MSEESKGLTLAKQIARTQVRAWMEKELGTEFGVDKSGVKPSLQIGIKKNRPLPDASLKWNKVTRGVTNPLEIERATMRYLERRTPNWGNNRSLNNDYTPGSTRAQGFRSPSKTVYFDRLLRTGSLPTACEAFTGPAPGTSDVEAWIYLSEARVVKPGTIINFQNEVGQSISEMTATPLVNAGYQVSVVPYHWWSPNLSMTYSTQFLALNTHWVRRGQSFEFFYPIAIGHGRGPVV